MLNLPYRKVCCSVAPRDEDVVIVPSYFFCQLNEFSQSFQFITLNLTLHMVHVAHFQPEKK